MQRFVIHFLTLFVLIFLFTCEESPPEKEEFTVTVSLSGAIQKGPFLNGTSVLVTELNSDLTPTGRTFSSQIENNAGLFQLPSIEYSSKYVELKADGYYYDEIRNRSSSSPLTLYAISDITNRSVLNVNLITTLERPRVKFLLNQGLDYDAAKDSAFQDVFDAFGFTHQDSSSAEDLNITSGGSGNAQLLAISLILQGGRSVADLSELVSNISFDISTDGALSSSSSIRELYEAVNNLDTAAIRSNLETRYDELGITSEIENFEYYLQSFEESQELLAVSIERIIDCINPLNSIAIASVLGGQPPYHYYWSNATPSNSDTLRLIDSEYGYYDLTISDDYQQTVSIDSIFMPSPLTIALESTDITRTTSGDINLDIHGGEEPYTISWSNGESSKSLENLSEGVYSVTVEDKNGCSSSDTAEIIDYTNIQVSDIDGNVYSAVKIGDQLWLAENLKVTHYRNGDAIDYVTDNSSWSSRESPAYCVYDNNLSNAETYGLLYNAYAVGDDRNIAIEGWKVPTPTDWNILIEYLGGEDIAGGKMKLQGTEYWMSPNYGGTNESGFTGLPAGARDSTTADYGGLGYNSLFWAAQYEGEYYGEVVPLYYDREDVNGEVWGERRGASIRLVKE